MLIKKSQPFLIGVAGGISSGKSSVCKKIIEEISKMNNQHKKHILIISLDSFYKKLSNDELNRAERGDHNLDHPQSFDDELAYKTLIELINGKNVEIPVYDKKSYRNSDEVVKLTAETLPDVIIIEGILVFYYPKIRDLFQMKLFVDCDADTRLSRRVKRDMSEYNRPLEQILNYYQKYVKPAFEEFCLPTKKYADVIIPRGVENLVAINLIVQHINDYINNSNQTSNSNNNNSNNENNNSYNYSKTSKLVDSTEQMKISPLANAASTSKPFSSNNLASLNTSPLSVNVGNQSSCSPGGVTLHTQLSSPNTPTKRSERPH